MYKRFHWLIGILLTLPLLLGIVLLSPSVVTGTTVTMTLKNPNISVQSKDTFVRFELQNYGNVIPKVLGSFNIIPSYVDLYPDVNGLVTGTIQANDTISP